MRPSVLKRSCLTLLALGVVGLVRAQVTNVQWKGASGRWSSGTNWSSTSVPGHSDRAVVNSTSALTVTADGTADIAVSALDVASNTASLVFDFSSAANALKLGSDASTWSAGNVEFRNGAGLAGSGIGSTTLTIGSGVEYLYSTATTNRYLQNLSVDNTGSLRASTGTLSISSVALANQLGGVVHADGAEIDFDRSTTLTNRGTLRATGAAGKLYFNGTQTTTGLGKVDLVNGGHAYLAGTVDNTLSTLSAPTGGSFELASGTVRGGSVAVGAVAFTSTGGTLDGTSLDGDLTLGAGQRVTLTGGANFTGAHGSLANSAVLAWQQAATLAGKTIAAGTDSVISVMGANSALTFDAGTSVTGDVEIRSDGSTGSAIVNLGSIAHTAGTGHLYAMGVVNSGTIAATGGTLDLGTTAAGATFTNAAGATLRVNGGSMALQLPAANPMVNRGTVDLVSGTFYTNNHLNNGATGLIRGAGAFHGDLQVSGGTLSPGNSGIGTLTFNNGTLTVTGAATFAVDLGGTSADQLLFQNPPSVVNLGSGLLALSLNLLNAPAPHTTYNLITISSGGSGIMGSFAGLPHSGDTITATFGGNPYTFAVNYQPNFVSLAYNPVVVPEPSTYVLMGAGLLVVAGARRRRRGRRR